ncbi:hypothetical protein ACFWPQ_08265 [Streptomyces sp. NPDC058464]|uniref:Imm32 family immunity protein n=1 Tax=Streptomyces sp. NPDC058464 TaxID=3346511 RepID=UPI003657B9BD
MPTRHLEPLQGCTAHLRKFPQVPPHAAQEMPAGHLLTLAQDGTPDGAHHHLAENNGLEQGSAGLVLESRDDE